MQADFELQADGSVKVARGARAQTGFGNLGAGRPKKGEPSPKFADNSDLFSDESEQDFDEFGDRETAKIQYESARARNELAKAQLNEIAVRIQSGKYVSRSSVQQASATMLATLAQTLRSIPDMLERKGATPDVCQMVEVIVNDALDGAASDLEMLGGAR